MFRRRSPSSTTGRVRVSCPVHEEPRRNRGRPMMFDGEPLGNEGAVADINEAAGRGKNADADSVTRRGAPSRDDPDGVPSNILEWWSRRGAGWRSGGTNRLKGNSGEKRWAKKGRRFKGESRKKQASSCNSPQLTDPLGRLLRRCSRAEARAFERAHRLRTRTALLILLDVRYAKNELSDSAPRWRSGSSMTSSRLASTAV